MKRWFAIGGAVVVVAVVLVVVGVGGSGTETVPSSTVAAAAAATAGARGFRMTMDAAISGESLPSRVTVKGIGAIDPRGRRGTMTFDMSRIPGGLGSMKEVFSGLVMYMRSPSFKRLPEGKSWVRFDLRRIQQAMGVAVPQAGPGNDPSQMVDQLRAVSGEVNYLGRDEVRGVATRHYRATVDMRRYANLLPPAKRAVARANMERLTKLIGASKFPEEVWIDARSHVRRFKVRYTFRIPALPSRPKMTVDMSGDLFAFGTPVHVVLPPADDTVDVTGLAAKQLQGLAGGQ